MRTQIFTHKGIIGIRSDIKAEGLLNDPKKPGQLGFVVNAEFVDIQPEALELLKSVKKSCDAIGDIDVYQSSKCIVIAWLGRPFKAFDPSEVNGSCEYDASLLKPADNVVTDPMFIKMVDENT
jgi:hypothetical protein